MNSGCQDGQSHPYYSDAGSHRLFIVPPHVTPTGNWSGVRAVGCQVGRIK